MPRPSSSSWAWTDFAELARSAKVASSWSVPVLGPGGILGVITVFRATAGKPQRDDLDLATLYAGYAASAIERDRLLDEVTSRNRVLETIREMLETLAGPTPVADGLRIALQLLRRGLEADEVALVVLRPGGPPACRAVASLGAPAGPRQTGAQHGQPAAATQAAMRAAGVALSRAGQDVSAQPSRDDDERLLSVAFPAPDGQAALVARWHDGPLPADSAALLEDAAHSLRLALQRQEAWIANQETAALRRSRELQRGFLSRLSHELRTPLTAIRGYASSLLQTDVSWDEESEQRFLTRIAAESARLGRLVDDLLRFSAIESGILQLQRDWCDIPLVLDAAIACLPPRARRWSPCGARPACPDLGRPRPPGTGLREPAGQRRGPQPAGHPGHGHGDPRRPGYGTGDRGRQRARDAGRRGAGTVRADAPPPVPRLRVRPGPVHCPGHRRGPRRPDGAGPARPGHLLPDLPAGGEPREPSGGLPARRRGHRGGGRDRARRREGSQLMLKQAGTTRALVVEDDPNIVDLIRSNLAVRGFDTVVSVDGLRALNLLETEEPDIVLLDLMLPEIDGFELCQLIRERSPVAIIVVSARGGERDKVTALNMGADDYLTKPFSIEELLARITATLRRTRPAVNAPQTVPPVITIGQVEINLGSQQVRQDGVAVHLTPTEFALLRELAINRGKLLTHAHLLRRVWGRGYETETEYVRVYIRRLRAKLETDDSDPVILTQPRAGYRIAAE